MHKIARTALQTLDVRNSLCFFSSNPFCPTVSNPTEAKSSGGEEVKKNRPVLHPLVVPKPWVWPELRAREEPLTWTRDWNIYLDLAKALNLR